MNKIKIKLKYKKKIKLMKASKILDFTFNFFWLKNLTESPCKICPASKIGKK